MKLSECDKQAIWLQSDEGSDWWSELDSSEDGSEERTHSLR